MSRRVRPPGGRPWALAASLTLAAGLTALPACGRSDYQHVQNDDEGVFIRLPRGWHVIENDLAPIALEGRAMVELWEVGIVAEPVAAGGAIEQAQGTLKVSAVGEGPSVEEAALVAAVASESDQTVAPSDDG